MDYNSKYQPILTRVFWPALRYVRGSRVKARAEAGSVTLSWDHSLDADGNHLKAARALMDKYGWKGDLISGVLPNNKGCCFVQVPEGTLWLLPAGRVPSVTKP